ncbi:MAG: hypothetical protein ACI3XQ_00305 [Eubacteriales bacterium]
MVEFTDYELLMISILATEKADSEIRRRKSNVFAYETAESIYRKAHDEYCERSKNAEG